MKTTLLNIVAFAFLSMFCSTAFAATLVKEPTISRVQGMVVVRSKEGFRHAFPGMLLAKGDEVRTGSGAKAYIDFPDNSRIKLGQRSQLRVRAWQRDNGLFSSALRIFRGAFRYTAGKLASGLNRRSTTITTQTAVLGVRGTDFWGRVGDDETFFLLLEGKVSLAPRFGNEIAYQHAGAAVHISPTNISAPQALKPSTIAPLAAETEIE
ncbi:MAG: FecR family protein [Mariprofundaceae bacterium]